jgi:ubiquinone/menaquinone biosynthesis C-methylase UbiE
MLLSNDHFIEIYKTRAAAYHALIAAEDADGNLLPALQALAPLSGKRVLDLGSGSGRIPLLLQGSNCEIVAVDLHHPMLAEAKQRMSLETWGLVQADLRQLPITSGWADVSVAGWAIGHFTGWYPDWKAEASRGLAEMERATRPGGALFILETLGTGVREPAAPNAGLAAYYAWLESKQGFTRQIVTTDYDFGSVERGAELCGFFFGQELAARVRANGWTRVPEWTGVWGRT